MMRFDSRRSRSAAFGAVTIAAAPVRDGGMLSPALGPSGGDLIVLITDGGIRLGQEVALEAGSAIVIPEGCTQWPWIQAVGDAEVTVLLMSSGLAQERPAPSAEPMVVRATTPLLTVAAALASSALQLTDDLPWTDRQVVERLFTDAVQALLADIDRRRRLPLAPNAFLQAQADIARRSATIGLTAEDLARGANLSLRQLERAFRNHGTTISREIRRARVEHALNLLGDTSREPLTVGQVARVVGFSNGSSLARAMQAEGHASPTAIRNEAAPPFTRNRSVTEVL